MTTQQPSLETLNAAYIDFIKSFITNSNTPVSHPILSQLLLNPSPSKAYHLLTSLQSTSSSTPLSHLSPNSIPNLKKYYSSSNSLTENQNLDNHSQSSKFLKEKVVIETVSQKKAILSQLGSIFKANQKKIERYEEISRQNDSLSKRNVF